MLCGAWLCGCAIHSFIPFSLRFSLRFSPFSLPSPLQRIHDDSRPPLLCSHFYRTGSGHDRPGPGWKTTLLGSWHDLRAAALVKDARVNRMMRYVPFFPISPGVQSQREGRELGRSITITARAYAPRRVAHPIPNPTQLLLCGPTPGDVVSILLLSQA